MEHERVRIQSTWEVAQNSLNSWSHAEGPTSVGSGDTTLLMATDTAGNASQSTLQNLSVTSAVSSSAFGCSQLTGGRNPTQREERNEFRREGEIPSVLSAEEDNAQNNLKKCQTTQRLQATREPPSIATDGTRTPRKVINRTVVVSLERNKPQDLSSRKS